MSELSQMRQEDVLPLIVSQLAEYGYAQLAQVVAEQTHTSVTIKPSSRLSEMLYIAQEESVEIEPTDHSKLQQGNTSGAMEEDDDDDDDDDEDEEMQDASAGATGATGTETSEGGDTNAKTKGSITKRPVMIRLNLDTDPKSSYRTKGPNLKTVYTTTHKEPVTCTTFSKDGRYAASGSADTSLKILDVNKMKLVDHDGGNDVHPVIRTLYDHTTPVTDCDFHPNGLVLAASSDTVVKLYDLSKPSVKRSFRYLQDSHPINSVSFHPSGDFLLVGSEAETVRIYDVKTLQCFTPKAFAAPPPPPTNRQSGGSDESAASAAAAQHQHQVQQQGPHRGGINHIEYAPTGSVFISASQDGSIKVWDAISGKVVRTIEGAHSGKGRMYSGATSATISKNGRYILSGGMDSTSKLWDLGSGKLIHSFLGATQKTEKQSTVFSYNEDYVFSSDESNNTIVCWDSRSGTLVKRYAGHQGLIRSVAASPTENGIISCGDDNRVRFWCTPTASAAAAAAANAQRQQQGHGHGQQQQQQQQQGHQGYQQGHQHQGSYGGGPRSP
ncbi:cleavage stimulation factor, 3' pre-RNA, subunit 1 [Linnemannia gamsii]|uniref:Cleavage stimulation factor 50 kDa subunit n=1 Tax=Linnemannia gamsii TaxID=64522 RepID=A0ABQ7K9G8_9FUNG|nr:cleavage stimulation factor, 3' pre-RNA, subunit 1 [Linnemannia gamsii]